MKERTRVLLLASTIFVAVVAVALSAGCSGTKTGPTTTNPPATTVTTTPSESATMPAASTTETPAVSGLELGKLIFETGNNNNGVIPTKLGIKKIKVNACKNCHGANGKGGKPLTGEDIRGSKLQPDFDEAAFAVAVTTGKDDTGKPLKSTMPRFSATPEDTAALWLYVNSLK